MFAVFEGLVYVSPLYLTIAKSLPLYLTFLWRNNSLKQGNLYTWVGYSTVSIFVNQL